MKNKWNVKKWEHHGRKRESEREMELKVVQTAGTACKNAYMELNDLKEMEGCVCMLV